MQILTLILSALAFLMGAGALILVIQETNRNHRSSKALRKTLADYVDRKAEEVLKAMAADLKKNAEIADGKIEKAASLAKAANARLDVFKKAIKENKKRISLLEEGCVPDYNEAMRAVNAVNEMNSGIANIFGFDPLEALQKSRQEGE